MPKVWISAIYNKKQWGQTYTACCPKPLFNWNPIKNDKPTEKNSLYQTERYGMPAKIPNKR